MKVCARCKEEKPLSEFGLTSKIDKYGNQRYNCYCKICNSERSTERYYKIKVDGVRFVYRILNKDGEVIYVGKTESLPNRYNQHFSKASSHLPLKAREEVHKLQFMAMSSSALMDIKEIYYINLYKPKYNMSYVYDEDAFTISDFSNDVWLDYDINVMKSFKREDFGLNISSIFKRKRNNSYLVYIEHIDIYGKKHQKRHSSFKSEEEASNCVKELKRLYNFE